MCIFIKNFSHIAQPLTHLTRKGIDFEFGPEESVAQEKLKHAIITSPVIQGINYTSDHPVILTIDTSYITIDYILSQVMPDSDKHCYPSCFGSILLNKWESHYSQPKLKLYRLFQSLCATQLYIIRVKNLIVKVDAKYIKGMFNHPDIQPNAMINCWIAGILLFNFKLVHVPGASHDPNGLSRCPAQPNDVVDPEVTDDYKDWIDCVSGFITSSLCPQDSEQKLID